MTVADPPTQAPAAPAEPAAPVPRADLGRQRVAEPVSNRVRRDGKFFRLGADKWYAKGFTYGPFAENDGEPLPKREQVQADFRQIADLGGNCVRVYHLPPAWLLEEAEAAGLKLLVDVAWPKNLTFHDDPDVQAAAREAVRDAAVAVGNHAAVFALSVANEIPAEIVRYIGADEVGDFLDDLVAEVKAVAPDCLVSFANFPSTEYLAPRDVDFVMYNVYLHEEEVFRRYMARLQMIAGEKPLVLGEYGIDTNREATPDEQAETLGTQFTAAYDEGLAGAFVFAFTDDWFTNGYQIDEWSFGVVDHDRNEKPAAAAMREVFQRVPQTARDVEWPRVSVVICSYNGGSTVESCLKSMQTIDYPDFEVVFVDDGSTDHTQDILKQFEADERFVNIRQVNKGLSVARTVGAEAATGEIIVYTDSDCEADEDWLYQIALQLTRSSHVGIGGPNLIPDEGSWVADCVGVSPGGPTHVMIDDRTAEHVPGCNMAFYREAVLEVGGFDQQFRKAGDDVDFIWRLQNKGYSIGFAPAAQVWHYRRNTVEAYLKQQRGYGEAEAMLKYKHPDRFNTLGSAHWRGRIYGAGDVGVKVGQDVIYHGVFGTGLFQTIYRRPASLLAQMLMSVEWHLLTVFIALLSAAFVPLLYVAGLMALVPVVLAFVAAYQTPKTKHHGPWSRPLIAYLHWRQPITRGWARYTYRLKQKQMSKRAQRYRRNQRFPFAPGDRGVLRYWATAIEPRDRTDLLKHVADEAKKAKLKFRVDSGWNPWDLELYGSRYVKVQLTTVTERHDAGLLTKVHVELTPSGFAKVIGIGSLILTVLLLALVWPFSRPAVLIPLGWAALYLLAGWRVRGPVLGLIDAAAVRHGFYPVWPKGEEPPEAREAEPALVTPSMRHEPSVGEGASTMQDRGGSGGSVE